MHTWDKNLKMYLQFISKIMKNLFGEKNKFFDSEKVNDFELHSIKTCALRFYVTSLDYFLQKIQEIFAKFCEGHFLKS